LNDPQVAPRLLKAIPISPQVVPLITLVAPTPLEANLVPLAQSMIPNTPSQTTKSFITQKGTYHKSLPYIHLPTHFYSIH